MQKNCVFQNRLQSDSEGAELRAMSAARNAAAAVGGEPESEWSGAWSQVKVKSSQETSSFTSSSSLTPHTQKCWHLPFV